MKLCFYNLFQIGDIYFSSFFIKAICESNKDMNFYYYFKNGDIYFKNIENIKRINTIEEYTDNHVSGISKTENLINNDILNLLKCNMDNIGAQLLNINNEKILFINTWCMSKYLLHLEYDIVSAMSSYRNCIQKINNDFNLNIKYDVNCKELLKNTHYNVYSNKYQNISYDETTLIFNYIPHSCNNYNMHHLNNYIKELSKTTKIILTCYNIMFKDNPNISFIDNDYNIIPNSSCSNLVEIWEIAIKCNKIIIIPSGCSWTFFHKIHEIKENQLFFFMDNVYSNRFSNVLNNSINTLLSENKFLIKLIS